MTARTRQLSIAAGALLLGLLFGRLLFSGSAEHVHADHAHAAADSSEAPGIWTCSMHPQVQQGHPGSCPICGMDLIPLDGNSDSEDGERRFSMSESAKALAEVQTSVVERRFPEAEVRLVGELAYDQTRVRSLTARFPARIEQLYVNYMGVAVDAGEHLARVYSPELLTAQRELLTAWQRDPQSSFAQAAREKLRLWGLLPEQIDAVLARGAAEDSFDLRSPISGVVVEQNVNEGDYLETGQPLFRIVDLSQLWLRLDAFESDLAWLRYGQRVEFTVESYPGRVFDGRIIFIEPELNRETRTVSVRVNVPNPDGRLKPGMFARGVVRAYLGAEGEVLASELAGKWISPMHPEIVKEEPGSCDVCGMPLVPAEELGYVPLREEAPPLLVPASAVLRTGKRAVVYVELPDTERPTFEGREIVLGPRAGDVYLVEDGLNAGDHVVTNGAFKIDSALQIQARPSMMNPEEPTPGTPTPSIVIEPALATRILPAYYGLQAALAGDDLDAAMTALVEMMAVTGHVGPLPDLIHAMLAAESLDELRRPHFETLSEALIAAVESAPEAFETVWLMHCPMVHPDRGANWLQPAEPLRNPYFGAAMLMCGEVRQSWNASERKEENAQ